MNYDKANPQVLEPLLPKQNRVRRNTDSGQWKVRVGASPPGFERAKILQNENNVSATIHWPQLRIHLLLHLQKTVLSRLNTTTSNTIAANK